MRSFRLYFIWTKQNETDAKNQFILKNFRDIQIFTPFSRHSAKIEIAQPPKKLKHTKASNRFEIFIHYDYRKRILSIQFDSSSTNRADLVKLIKTRNISTFHSYTFRSQIALTSTYVSDLQTQMCWTTMKVAYWQSHGRKFYDTEVNKRDSECYDLSTTPLQIL